MNLTNQLRAILRSHPEGLPVTALMDMTNVTHRSNMNRRLHDMPDTYIDRWEEHNKTIRAVWCIVVPPDDCPHPKRDMVAFRQSRRKAVGQAAPAA